ncbi:amino acid adenylation [Aspergillus homomorphus CBS 101889]|uniref:Amino acid adenylation n=1 Tax=Aspergillus homomorphus (strain CBS 101889) TaxID=1450537 RepID=A0A395HJ02_ASPHC|nr:amino acid adenylation [Aspergillus homomorphus CBS 101889]RAL07616.1 amino acid adenylation [Aspergillus homomorphus CBS 101889]
MDSFFHVLNELLLDPDRKERELAFLGLRSIDLVHKWNSPGLTAAELSCIHTLILQRCHKQPQAQAISAWDGSLTYGELDRLSNAAAQVLASRNIGAECVVPICFEKSLWTAVAILGVLRAGAAFTLLDPSYPLPRLRSICEDVKPQLILTSRAQVPVGQQLNETVLVLPEIAQASTSNEDLCRVVTPETAAYVAFTSGSTGKPKGVVIEHRSFCASARHNAPAQQLQASSRVLQYASYGFDISIQEILSTLIVGGCICVPSEEQRLQSLGATIRELEVNWVELTPTVARMLQPDQIPLVQTVVLGGEPILPSDLATWSQAKQQLMVAYGPTECSIVATVCTAPDVDDPLNIGNSISGTCWVVDPQDHHQLLPLGAMGELIIGGPIVGRGYMNRPTDKNFFRAPQWAGQFGLDPNQRFYRTGDLVRYNVNDGTLRYGGRKDTQVKIQGQRVELHEIEHCAELFEFGMRAVAEILTPTLGPPRLALFVVEKTIDTCRVASFARLHEWLASRLARFMVPSLYIPLTHLPISPTGKVDRKRLRHLAAEMPGEKLVSYVASVSVNEVEMNAMERTIHQLVVDQLQIPAGSVHLSDSFFKLGGTSLMAINLVTKLRDQGWELSMVDVFTHQTISALAKLALPVQSPSIVPAFSLMEQTHRPLALRKAAEQCQLSQEMIIDMYPCTALQEALMLLTAERGVDFTATFIFRLDPRVDVGLFRQCWEKILAARPILRSRIVSDYGEGLYQLVVQDVLDWITASDLEQVQETIDAYSLSFGRPLTRFGIADRGSDGLGPVFVLRMHHAVFDGWSYRCLLEDLEQLYHGQPLVSRESMTRLLQHNLQLDHDASRNFWSGSFQGFHGQIYPPPPPGWVTPLRTTVKRRQISVPTAPLNAGYTMATVIQLAWSILIAGRTGSDDVAFGTTVSGRNSPVPGIANLMGPTIATFPVRVALDRNATIETSLERIQSWFSSAIPFEQTGLAQISKCSPEAAQACQFQTLLTIQPRSLAKDSPFMTDMPQNQLQQQKFLSHILTIVVDLQENGMHVEAIFDADTLYPQHVVHMLKQFEGTVHRILQHPRETLDTIRGYGDCDREQIGVWNPTPQTFHAATVHGVIQNHLISQPDAPAVSSWDGIFSYRELIECARQWAGYLQLNEVSPGSVVAVCMERSKWQIVAILGVLMADSAFVLLEPGFPRDRLREMCQVSNAAAVIVSHTTEAKIRGLGVSSEIVLDVDRWLAVRQTDQSLLVPPVANANAHTPMYVAFTSGSTGVPKCMVIEHAMCHISAQAYQASFGLHNTSRVLYNSSVAFDLAILEIMWTLLAGACICIPSEEDRLSDLPKAMRDLQINWASLTPSVARTLSPAELPPLEVFLLVGEAVSTADIDKWAGQVPLKVGYGPAECAVASTMRDLSPSTRSEPSNVGRSLNGRTWVVDPDNYNCLLPVGAIGELLLSGPMVARGYVNNSLQTHASFVRCPVWARDFDLPPEERFYRTGDLVRYSSDGTLVFLGRKDTQVKVHGQRIELQEIEHQVTRLIPDMMAVASLVSFEALGQSKLVLFIAPKIVGQIQPDLFDIVDDQNQPSPENLLESLRAALPPYMVPSIVIPTAWLPLTSSGKTDRKLLQQMASKLPAERLVRGVSCKRTLRRPETHTQSLICRIFADALKIPEHNVGIDDSFFGMGGDSLLAMRVLASCRKRNLRFTITDLLEQKSIRVLAEEVDARRRDVRPHIQNGRDGGTGNITLCKESFCKIKERLQHAQRAMSPIHLALLDEVFECPAPHVGIIADQFVNPGTHKQRSLWEIQSSQCLGAADVAYTLEQIIQRHDMLRSVLVPWSDPMRPTQAVLKSAHGAIKVLKNPIIQSTADLWKVKPARCLEGAMPHHSTLAEGPDGQVWWLFEFDKALIDAASMTILLSEMSALCLSRGAGLAPAPRYTQYAAYVNDLPSAKDDRLFWKHALLNTTACLFPKSSGLELACSSVGSAPQVRTVVQQIAQTESLTGLSQAAGMTVTNVFQTIWGLILGRTLSSEDVCFGTLKSCRDAAVPEILQMVGPLFNILPCRLHFPSLQPTPDQLLEMLRTNQAAQIERTRHQHVSLQHIVQITGHDRLFNTCLTVQPAMEPTSGPDDNEDGSPSAVKFKLLQSYDPTEYHVVAAVILFPSHAELHIRYWDDFLSESDAQGLLDSFGSIATQVTTVLASACASP